MKKSSAYIWNNCLLGASYLFLRGKVHTVVAISSKTVWFPWHFVTCNRNGHVIHFQAAPELDEFLATFWYHGRFVGIRKSEQPAMLAQTGRKVCFSIPAGCFFFWWFLIMPAVAPLWCFCFALYPLIRIIRDVVRTAEKCWCLSGRSVVAGRKL